MKTVLVKISLTIGVCSLALLNSCGDSASHNHDDSTHDHDGENHEHTYSCPMHPEVTGHEGETCPKCGMALVHTDVSTSDNVYVMQFTSSPATIEAGKEVTLSFTPKIKGKETEQVPLDVLHEKKIHLIAVSKDLSWFDHVHPEYNADGSYQLKTTFPSGGDYILYADYNPSGATHQLEKINISVTGTPSKEVQFAAQKTIWSNDKYGVELKSADGKYVTGSTMHISGIVTEKGKPFDVNKLDNYLGAKAHMVIVKSGTHEYLHVHPDVNGTELDLHAMFETPGIYRGWLQFQLNGELFTSDFVFNVEQGVAASGDNHDHGHGEDHDHKH